MGNGGSGGERKGTFSSFAAATLVVDSRRFHAERWIGRAEGGSGRTFAGVFSSSREASFFDYQDWPGTTILETLEPGVR